MDRAFVDAHLAQLKAKHRNLDALCKRCGWCCHFKALVKNKSYFSTKTCPHLVDKRCSIYVFRFERYKLCLHLEDAIAQECMPKDCPYVVSFDAYVGPETDQVVVEE